MSLVSFVKGIDFVEARRFVGLIDTGLDVLKFAAEKMKDDGRISGQEGLEILDKALGHHGICLGCDAHEVDEPDEPVRAKRPRRRRDDRGYTLRFKASDETPEAFAEKLAGLETLADRGVCLECNGEVSYQVSQQPSERHS
ncbi:MAG: hypothetical protein ABW127_13585 [Candidatus Thiodiazotropha endolucinida]